MGERKVTSMARSPLFLWIAFVLVHAWLGWQGFIAESVPYGDVSFVYSFWAHQAIGGGPVVGIDTEWVYPILAFIPMVIPTLGGLAPTEFYPYAWIVLVTLINAAVFSFLIGSWTRGTVRTVAAWWWLAFLLCLGPISVARIDSIATPIAMVGLVFAISRPTVATTLLTVAAWIKVWPAAVVGTLWVAGRGRTRIVVAAAMTSAVVASIALVLGAGGNVLSFLTQQTGRGLQIESPAANFYVWMSAAKVPGFAVYYDQALLTFQVRGAGADIVAQLSTVVLVAIAVLVLAIGMDAKKHGAVPLRILGPLALAMTTALVAFNKVGSPQYIGWLAVPIVFGLVIDRPRFQVPALITLVIALITQAFYPYLYLELLNLNPWLIAVLSVRNVLEFVLLGYAIVMVARLRTEARAREVRHTAVAQRRLTIR
jgi:hypothetical protein